jgi:Ca2+-binding EF-hand superfamily protein
MKQSFKAFDKDTSGFLDRNELRNVLKCHRISFSEENFEALFELFDTNGDGLFGYSEFVKMMQAN